MFLLFATSKYPPHTVFFLMIHDKPALSSLKSVYADC